MYSWYFPKDEPTWLESLVGVGHRHDWEGIVVWLSGESSDATLLGVAASYHGDYVTSTDPALSGNSPLIKYYTAYAILDHSTGFTDTVGGTQPLIAWDSLPTVAQEALANKDWGGKCFRRTIVTIIILTIIQTPMYPSLTQASRLTSPKLSFSTGCYVLMCFPKCVQSLSRSELDCNLSWAASHIGSVGGWCL